MKAFLPPKGPHGSSLISLSGDCPPGALESLEHLGVFLATVVPASSRSRHSAL